ncbi:diguanylate cyclase [Vibrio sp. CDRSL-10 TSBA]
MVALDPQFATHNWNKVGEQFLAKAQLVRNIALAPNDVIHYVYPLQGNEKAIGLDFRTVPHQYRTVQIARQNKKVFLAGPLELVQGGKAIIARYPIFTDVPYNTEYWGGLSVVISYDNLIALSNLHNVKGADIALVANGHDGFEKRLIEGDEATLSDFDINYPISLPNGSWTLFAKYKDLNEIENINSFKSLFITLGTITFAAGYLLVVFFISNYFRAQKHSLQDDLTHLPNRRYLFNELNRIMSKGGANIAFTVLNIDLNKFKKINDTYGHEAGDAVLKHTAMLLQKSTRSADFISRMGGDEFIVILPRMHNPDDVEQVIDKIQRSIKTSPLQWQNEEIPLSSSVGFLYIQRKSE